MKAIYSSIGVMMMGLFLGVQEVFASTHSDSNIVSFPDAPPPGTGNTNTSCSDSGSCQLINPLSGIDSIPAFFQAILDIVMILAIPFIVFFIIYAGFLFVMAQGNPDKISKANNALLYALIGGVLILAANVLLAVVTGTVEQFTG